jgi:hypothetical protein
VAKTPSPPALETAATSLGTDTQLIPGSNMGYWIPNMLVIAVFHPLRDAIFEFL